MSSVSQPRFRMMAHSASWPLAASLPLGDVGSFCVARENAVSCASEIRAKASGISASVNCRTAVSACCHVGYMYAMTWCFSGSRCT